MRVLHRKLVRDLWHIRGQALAILLVIASGVALTTMSVGVMQALVNARAEYYERYRFADVFARLKRAPEAVAQRIAEIPGVARVQTRVVADVNLDMPGMAEPVTGRMISLPDWGEPALNAIRLRRGRLPDQGHRDEVVVSEPFADAHRLRPSDRFGAVLNGRKRELQMVGTALSPEYILTGSTGTAVPDDRRFGVIWMGRKALASVFDLDGAFNDVSVSLLRGASELEVRARLDALLERYGGTGAYGRRNQASHAAISSELTQITRITELGMPIFLGIIAFLLNMVMSRLIATEREQIGLLKAFGYSNGAVARHYLNLVLIIAGLGIVIGCAGGVRLGEGLTAMYAQYYRFPSLSYRLTPLAVGLAVFFHILAACLGPLGALRQAARLPPAVAMAPAPPPVYRKGLLDQVGLSRFADAPLRMILRHILRWPVRAGLTGLGIASAVAILVGLISLFDSIDVVIDEGFFRLQRQDATVSFVEPRSDRAAEDLRHLPGVLGVEPFRAVATELRHGPRSWRVTLMGVEPAGDMSRTLDDAGHVVVPAKDSLVISRWLAETLDVGLGGSVTVDVMEGRRPLRELPVVAVIDDHLGLNARMERAGLNRLMGEGPALSGAFLRVDASRENEFYVALKGTPVVAQVVMQRAELKRLRQSMSENMRMVYFYVLFACIIAFGVVFNSARIALSERGRELASLRVLGFTRFEVSYILLGELGLITLLALPIGCGLGFGLAALLKSAFDNDNLRIPLVVDPSTYGMAVLAVVTAAAVSALIVRRRIDRLDLVAVLKTRE